MNIEKKVKLYVNPISFIISLIILIVVAAGIFVLMYLLYPPQDATEKAIAIFLFCFVELIPCIGIIVSYQTASIDDNGITFKVAIWKRAVVRWCDIVKIDIKEVNTWYSWIKIYKKKWIVFYANVNHTKDVMNEQTPYQLIYSKRNIAFILNICKRINDKVDINALIAYQNQI